MKFGNLTLKMLVLLSIFCFQGDRSYGDVNVWLTICCPYCAQSWGVFRRQKLVIMKSKSCLMQVYVIITLYVIFISIPSLLCRLDTLYPTLETGVFCWALTLITGKNKDKKPTYFTYNFLMARLHHSSDSRKVNN